MVTVPQDVIDLLNEARKRREEANDASVVKMIQEQELEEAVVVAQEAAEEAFEQLQKANDAAGIALDAIRQHFGV